MELANINALIKRIAAHQRALGLSDARFAARYTKYLGSFKTWTKLKTGTWEGHVKQERIQAKLQTFVDQIDGARSFDNEQFLDTLPYVTQMNAQFERLLSSPLDIRGCFSLAREGVGKSWWATGLLNAHKDEPYFYLRFLHSWREKSYQIQCALTEKLGGKITRNPGDQMTALIAHAQTLGEFVVLLDEAHNGGIVLFKVLKDLIDETRMRFVYLGFPTEFDVIITRSTSAIGESRQTLRRCLQPIHDEYRNGVDTDDIEHYLVGQGFRKSGELKAVAKEIQPMVTSRYNLTTLASAVRDARNEAEEAGEDMTLGMVSDAVKSLCSSADQRREALAAVQGGKS